MLVITQSQIRSKRIWEWDHKHGTAEADSYMTKTVAEPTLGCIITRSVRSPPIQYHYAYEIPLEQYG